MLANYITYLLTYMYPCASDSAGFPADIVRSIDILTYYLLMTGLFAFQTTVLA